MTALVNMSDDEVLQYTQRKRIEIIEGVAINDVGIPLDDKDRALVQHLLADMDRTTLTKKRLQGEEKTAAAMKTAADAINHVFAKLGSTNPFESATPVMRTLDAPAVLIEDVPIADGELEQGLSTTTYDEFAARTGLQRSAAVD